MKFPLWATLFTVLGIAVLCALGTWQLKRLEWKTEMLSRIETEYARNPAKNKLNFKALQSLGEQETPLVYGTVNGKFDYSREILLGPKTHKKKIGYHVITPLMITHGGHILVNRGFVTEDRKNPEQRPDSSPRGRLTLTGIFRKPDWNSFTPGNSPENNIWTKPDIENIAKAKGIERIAPVMLYAESSSIPFDGIITQATRWTPRNKHMQYAIFWFTMAGILALVFVLRFLKRSK